MIRKLFSGGYGRELPVKNSDLHPLIVVLSPDFELIREISLDKFLPDISKMNVQGVAYDSADDAIWFTDSHSIYEISLKGDLLREIGSSKYSKPNGLAYDVHTDHLWVLYFYGDLVEYNISGQAVRTIRARYADQDQITINDGIIYMTVGADYKGNDNFLLGLDMNSGEVIEKYRLQQSYAVEV